MNPHVKPAAAASPIVEVEGTSFSLLRRDATPCSTESSNESASPCSFARSDALRLLPQVPPTLPPTAD